VRGAYARHITYLARRPTVHIVTVDHNAEMAHRLYGLGPNAGKCWGLHGHSWGVQVDVAARDLDARGMVVEYGQWKRLVRTWVDDAWDHGVVLNGSDPLCATLRANGAKVYALDPGCDPTVEFLAAHLANRLDELLGTLSVRERAAGASVVRVRLQETRVNAATWVRP
jgi:6-pyruvoyltetrahydropterin/6-carboxytetrahydropterin synthase